MTSTHTTPRGQRMPRSERRAQLLDAAQAVFVQSGYHAAAMDEIADRAGVSKPVLYQHFPGKLDLYLALLDKHCDTLESLVRAALEVGGDNELRVERTVAAYFEFVTSEGAAFRMVFESDLTSVPQVRARLDAVEMNCAEAIAEVIAEDTGADDERALMLGVGPGRHGPGRCPALAGPGRRRARAGGRGDDQRPRLARAWGRSPRSSPDPTAPPACSLVADAGMPPAERGLA